MPYTIKLLENADPVFIHKRLREQVEKDGRFRIESFAEADKILLAKVRLTQKKEYCGNHPGECIALFVPRKKIRTHFLEWDDWVEFHSIVNGLLVELKISADVWSRPQDARGKFWIRKGLQARVRYDYEDDWRGGVPIPTRIWNLGTPDQFKKGTGGHG